MFRIEFLEEAKEEFAKLDRTIQKLIKEKLEVLSKNPSNLKNNIKPLKGEYSKLFRLRVANYRIIYLQEKNKLLITIVRIGHRKEIY